MFKKHIYTKQTGELYEKIIPSGGFYQIWDVKYSKYINEDRYLPYLEWTGTLEEVNIDPAEPTTEEKWDAVRSQRNLKLYQSDWTDLPHAPLTDEKKSEWQTYRQDLRDITLQTDPDNLTLPTVPQ
jgi:hypothetical protein